MIEENCRFYEKGKCKYPGEHNEECLGSDCEVIEIICPKCKSIIK